MQNAKKASELLEQWAEILKLKGENVFKVRAFEKAAQILTDKSEGELKERAASGTLTEIDGIGKGISEVLTEFYKLGASPALDELKKTLPPGLTELSQVSGLGPKKALQLIEEFEIKSLGELEYACRENRLVNLKGFGEKLQAKILASLEFLNAGKGQMRLSDAFGIAEKVFTYLSQHLPKGRQISEVGALRRRRETLEQLEFQIEGVESEFAPFLKSFEEWKKTEGISLPVLFYFSGKESWGYELVRNTAAPEFFAALGVGATPFQAATEAEFFSHLKVTAIPPESMETKEAASLARTGKFPDLVKQVEGVFHLHTTRSDGSHSLEEMVKEAIRLGYRYLGVTDHSQSAFYAQGLKTDALKEQWAELEAVRKKYPDFKIFWGIESDILADGSLDYDEKTLSKFDFVIASIHSRFQMDKTTMTERLIQAIRNPHTTMIGHLTGRLLLGRPGYELETDRVIEEAKKQGVIIEINAHPSRLDIDWRWGEKLRKEGVMVSINPDAHDLEGLTHTAYGLTVARKALLPSSLVFNTRTAQEIQTYFQARAARLEMRSK